MTATGRVVVAGTHSGVGKTTVATGLMAALTARGRRVAAFKVGPDFIDPSYHRLATGRPSRNLDTFLSGPDLVPRLFAHGAAGADVAVVEGVMGLFDGASGGGELASTAEVAKLLDAPVVLVVDVSGLARSVAALVHGYATFDPHVRLGGVVLNRVGSAGHAELARAALAPLGVPVLGALRRDDRLSTPSRHLGLVPVAERAAEARRAVADLGRVVAAAVDLAAVEALAAAAPPLACEPWRPPPGLDGAGIAGDSGAPLACEPWRPRPGLDGAGIAGDSGAPQACEPWRPRPGLDGAGIAGDPDSPPGRQSPPSSGAARPATSGRGAARPVTSGRGPARPATSGRGAAGPATSGRGAAGPATSGRGPARPVVAIAGGPAFSFVYDDNLDLLAAAGADLAVFDPTVDEALPEGTAALYLGGGFPEVHGDALSANAPLRAAVVAHAAAGRPLLAECGGLLYLCRRLDGRPMCGVLPADGALGTRLRLGYRHARAASVSPLWEAGQPARGHEFHYSSVTPAGGPAPAWRLDDGRADGFVAAGVHASYLHTHWAATPEVAGRFVAAARAARGGAPAGRLPA